MLRLKTPQVELQKSRISLDGLEIILPDGWQASAKPTSREEDPDEFKDFAPPDIPPQVSQQASGKDGFTWEDPNTGRTYVKKGRVWERTDGSSNDDPRPSHEKDKADKEPQEAQDVPDPEVPETAPEPEKKGLGEDIEDKLLDDTTDAPEEASQGDLGINNKDSSGLNQDYVKKLLAMLEEDPEKAINFLKSEAETIDGEKSNDKQDLDGLIKELSNSSIEELTELANQLDGGQFEDGSPEETFSPKHGRDNRFYTPNEQSRIPEGLHRKLFDMGKGIFPELTPEEEQQLNEIMRMNAEGVMEDDDGNPDIEGLEDIIAYHKDEYDLPERLTNAGVLWGDDFYKYINAAIYDPAGAEDVDIMMAEQLNEMLHNMPGYSHSDVMQYYAEEEGIDNASADFLPPGMLQRGENFKNTTAREDLLRFYEEGMGKDYILEPRILATTALKYVDTFLRQPSTKYIIHSKANGNGRGVSMDPFKDGLSEGEVAYPSYSPFKVLKVDRIKDIPEDRDAPFISAQKEYMKNIGKRPYINELKDTELKNALANGGQLSYNQLSRLYNIAEESQKYRNDSMAMGAEYANAQQGRMSHPPISSDFADAILSSYSKSDLQPYAEIHLQEL